MPNGSTPNEGTGPSNPQGDLIELKVKNAISAEVETYRTTMENYYKRFETAVKWIASAFVALAGAAVALFYFFVGPNIKEAKEEVPQLLKQQVNQLVIQMEVEKTAIQEISNNIRDFTAGAIASASNEINASVMVLLRGEVHTELGKFPTKELTNLLRSVPIGTIATYGGTNITPESGWLVCNGREVQRAVYSNLFDAISNTWGSGNGSNTFNLPNLQGMFLRGVDTNGTVDPDCQTRVNSQGQPVGAVVGSFQEDAFQGHYCMRFGNITMAMDPAPVKPESRARRSAYTLAGIKISLGKSSKVLLTTGPTDLRVSGKRPAPKTLTFTT